jgi:hypothetical protein
MSRIGKIGRWPEPVRDHVDRRLQAGEVDTMYFLVDRARGERQNNLNYDNNGEVTRRLN